MIGCLSTMAGNNEQGADFVEGSIREVTLDESWNRPDAFAYNRQWDIESLEGFCRECRHVKRCRGGCRAKLTASWNGVDNPMCVYRALDEQGSRVQRAGQAAAIAPASMLGVSAQSC